jgi:hypothetical protein
MTDNDRCELDGCNRKQSRTGWRIIVNGEAKRVCGHHAAIDRNNRQEAGR